MGADTYRLTKLLRRSKIRRTSVIFGVLFSALPSNEVKGREYAAREASEGAWSSGKIAGRSPRLKPRDGRAKRGKP